jgi:ssDNA-binding Zn-finger/Zn-ribbon topoisomerase 1
MVVSGLNRQGDHYEVAHYTCPDCGEDYILAESHRRMSKRHLAWVRGSLEEEVPVPPQPPALKYREGEPPERVVFGDTVICPRCKGRKRNERRTRSGMKPAEDFTRDPYHPDKVCPRCNGVGLVPNVNV